jgi:endo-1,4-beta-xylanase
VELVRRLLEEGIPITAVGLQNHDRLAWPSVAQEDSTIEAFARLGVRVMITELDVDVLPEGGANPFVNGLPDSLQHALARRYTELFGSYLRHRVTVTRVTFWGVTDRDSWLNGWPVRGRTNYPLLFDRDGRPKPAFTAVIAVAGRGG